MKKAYIGNIRCGGERVSREMLCARAVHSPGLDEIWQQVKRRLEE